MAAVKANILAFRRLIKKYESLTPAIIQKKMNALGEVSSNALKEITGFGSPTDCTLCKTAKLKCDRCVYFNPKDPRYPCVDTPYYREVSRSREAEELINNLKLRTKMMKKVLSKIDKK